MKTVLAVIAGLALAGVISACTLFDTVPDRSCKGNSDCFVAQGEHCDLPTKTCVVAPDAGP